MNSATIKLVVQASYAFIALSVLSFGWSVVRFFSGPMIGVEVAIAGVVAGVVFALAASAFYHQAVVAAKAYDRPLALLLAQEGQQLGLAGESGAGGGPALKVRPVDLVAGCFFVPIVLVAMLMLRGGTSAPTAPAASQPAVAPAAATQGRVDLAGRVEPGKKVYTKTGAYFGVVAEAVTTDSEGQECIRVTLADGTPFLLRRAAVRQGNTWFTDP